MSRNVNNGILAEEYLLQALCRLNFHQVQVLDCSVPQTIWYPFQHSQEDKAGIDFVLTLESGGAVQIMPLQLTLEKGRHKRNIRRKYERAQRGEVALFHLIGSSQLRRDPFGLLCDAARGDQLALEQLDRLFEGVMREFLERQSHSNQRHILELLASCNEARTEREVIKGRRAVERRRLARKILDIIDVLEKRGRV